MLGTLVLAEVKPEGLLGPIKERNIVKDRLPRA